MCRSLWYKDVMADVSSWWALSVLLSIVVALLALVRRAFLTRARTSRWLARQGVALLPDDESRLHRWVVRMSMARTIAVLVALAAADVLEVPLSARARQGTESAGLTTADGSITAVLSGAPFLAYLGATLFVDAWRRRDNLGDEPAVAVVRQRSVFDASDDSLSVFAFLGTVYVAACVCAAVVVSASADVSLLSWSVVGTPTSMLLVVAAALVASRVLIRRAVRVSDDATLAVEELLAGAALTSVTAVLVAACWMIGGSLLMGLVIEYAPAVPMWILLMTLPAAVSVYAIPGYGTYATIRTTRIRQIRQASGAPS